MDEDFRGVHSPMIVEHRQKSGSFGIISGASGMRVIQVGGRILL